MSRIFVESLTGIEKLLDLLVKVPILCRRHNVRLIVIDSITSLFRGVFSASRKDLATRANCLFEVSAKLRAVAAEHSLAVMVVNQVTSSMSDKDDARGGFDLGPDPLLDASAVAALGLSWSNCVNMR